MTSSLQQHAWQEAQVMTAPVTLGFFSAIISISNRPLARHRAAGTENCLRA